jgi:hypothetical protein
MKTMMIATGLCLLFSGLGVARADVGVGFSAGLIVEPRGPAPTMLPPLPPAALPPAPGYVAGPPRVAIASAATDGQWVFTSQYGWLYMPCGSRYVVTSASPYAYAYAPTFGWRWLSAPWVIGSGPYPHFGSHGPFAYAWYRGLRADHPMAVHYTHVGGRFPTGLRATVPVHQQTVVRPVAPPARFNAAPVTTRARPATVAWQRTPGSPTRAAVDHRGARR